MGLTSLRVLLLTLFVVSVGATDLKNPKSLGDYWSDDKSWESKWTLKQKIFIYGGCLVFGWILRHKILPLVRTLTAKKSN